MCVNRFYCICKTYSVQRFDYQNYKKARLQIVLCIVTDLSAPTLVHEPVGTALDRAYPLHRTHLRLLQLDIASLLQWELLLCILLHRQGLL